MSQKVAAAILCGGRGERLRPLTDFFQKTMVPVGPKKRPLLEYIVRLLAFHGVTDIAMLTGYRTEEIREYFEDGTKMGVRIRYSEDEEGPKGSLNAVAKALSNGAIPKCDVLLVYYGDILSDLNVSQLLEVHRKERADATLVLASGYTLPVGVASVKRGRKVVKFQEKPTLDISVMVGCMAVGPKGQRLMRRIAGKENTDLMAHFVPALIKRKGNVAAYYTKEFWYDVGTLTSYQALNSELKDEDLTFLSTPRPTEAR